MLATDQWSTQVGLALYGNKHYALEIASFGLGHRQEILSTASVLTYGKEGVGGVQMLLKDGQLYVFAVVKGEVVMVRGVAL